MDRSGQGPEVTGSFFDVSEKLKEEVKGNRRTLRQCLGMLDVTGTGMLSCADFSKALGLLKVKLSVRSIEQHLSHFVTPDGLVDCKRLMAELFPASEELRDFDSEMDSEIDAYEREFRAKVQSKWGSLLSAFSAIDTKHDKVIDPEELQQCLQKSFGMNINTRHARVLFGRFDSDGTGQITFEEFMEIFGQKATDANLLQSKNIQEIKTVIRESIESKLDGGGGGGLLKAFKLFDRDRSGSLTYAEMAEGINRYTNMTLQGPTMAKLMQEYDPQYTGRIDFHQFTRHVMGSAKGEQSSVAGTGQKSAHATRRADSAWPVEKLEQEIKSKLERAWTQVMDACRTADMTSTNTISPAELRGILHQYCFVLSDAQFEQILQRCAGSRQADGELPYEEAMRYFARLGGTYYKTLDSSMTLADAKAAIQEKILSKLQGGDGGLLRAFKMFDRDRSGSLSYTEFAKILREVAGISMDADMSRKLMESYDVDGDGELDYHEFVQQVMGSLESDKTSFDNEVKQTETTTTAIKRRWDAAQVDACLRQKLAERAGAVKRALDSCDVARDGKVTTSDLRNVLKKHNLDMTNAQFREVMSHFDVDSQGRLEREDFVQAYVDFKSNTVPRDVSVINDMAIDEAKQLIQDSIRSRLGTGQAELLRAFKFFDRDRSGTIGVSEFQEAMKNYAMVNFSDAMAKKLMGEFDADGNGEIDYMEFVTLVMGSTRDDNTSLSTRNATVEDHGTDRGNDIAMLRVKVRTQWKSLLQSFRDVDVDKSGTLDTDELKRVLYRFNIDLGTNQFNELMAQIDEDGDGTVSYAEFMKFFGKGTEDDRVLHSKVQHVTAAQARQMIREKISERLQGGPAELRRAFQFFDRDRSGQITQAEFREASIKFIQLEFEDHIYAELMRIYDTEGTGAIDYQHFCNEVMGGNAATSFDHRDESTIFRAKKTASAEKPTSPPTEAPAAPSNGREEEDHSLGLAPNSHEDTHSGGRAGISVLRAIAQKVEEKSANIRKVFEYPPPSPLPQQQQAAWGADGCPTWPSRRWWRRRLRRCVFVVWLFLQVFRSFDEDKSGSIDYVEFRRGLAHIGMELTDQEFGSLLAVVDNDKSVRGLQITL